MSWESRVYLTEHSVQATNSDTEGHDQREMLVFD